MSSFVAYNVDIDTHGNLTIGTISVMHDIPADLLGDLDGVNYFFMFLREVQCKRKSSIDFFVAEKRIFAC